MTYRFLIPLGLAAFLWLAGCGGPSEVVITPVDELSPSPTARATRSPVSSTPRPLGTLAARTPTPMGTPPTVTSTSEPTPSAALSRAARDLDDKLDDFRAAVRDGDNQRALNLQRGLLSDIEKAEQVARGDKTKFGEQMLAALSALRAGLGGDLSKLDAARVDLRKISGRSATPSGTPGKDSTAQSIDSLETFAAGLAEKVASFERALAKNDTGALLGLQSDLLVDINRAETQLKDSRSQQAELIRSALGELRAGMAGETNKLPLAEAKLREAAGQGARTTQTANPAAATPATTPSPGGTVTPQATSSVPPRANAPQLAGDLRGKLDDFVRATQDANNPQNLDRARRELQDQLAKAESAVRDDDSPQAGQLRSAIGQIRDAMGGDTAKIEAARRSLDAVGR